MTTSPSSWTSSLPAAADAAPAMPLAAGHRLVPLTEDLLEAILPIENVAFSHPWSHGNFADALRSGYTARLLMQGDEVLGYFVAMQILDEVHLLNLTVSPLHQGRGFARELLDILCHWSRHTARARSLWLEVRESNQRARRLYARYGFADIGARKKYYPVHHGERETAILMNLPLWP